MDKVICIAGSTGVGKTELAIALAQMLDTEIINGDAIQVFKEVDVLSAKITKSEMCGIEHHLLDEFNLEETFDVARFKKEATSIIRNVNAMNKIPIVVGGSGLYLKSLLYDYKFDDIQQREGEIAQKYNSYSNEDLFKHLQEIDLEASIILHPNNRKRVLRAIEIFEINRVKKTDFIKSQKHELEFDALVLGLDMERSMLYERINSRVDKMVDNGLIDEVRKLNSKYPNEKYQVFQAIGYKELVPYLDNEISLDEALSKIKQNSRRYAKKQMTWFKNQMEISWITSNPNDYKRTIEDAKTLVKEFLKDEKSI